MENKEYIGSELSIFAKAINWKKYFSTIMHPYVGKYVIEVGAGFGATTQILCDGFQDTWICLEPDPNLFLEILRSIQGAVLPGCCIAKEGYLADLENFNQFDTIIYIDVLEHIEKDRDELAKAMDYLVPGGMLIVLSPAYNFLYSPFDRSIGHYRRYTKTMMGRLTPAGATLVKIHYLDSVGLLTSLINRWVLRQAMPTSRQILFWDRYLIPITRFIDPLVRFSFGRSIIAIWKSDG